MGNRVDSVGTRHLVPRDRGPDHQRGGKTGQAVSSTARLGRISLADNATLSAGTSSFTIACWVYLDGRRAPTGAYGQGQCGDDQQ